MPWVDLPTVLADRISSHRMRRQAIEASIEAELQRDFPARRERLLFFLGLEKRYFTSLIEELEYVAASAAGGPERLDDGAPDARDVNKFH